MRMITLFTLIIFTIPTFSQSATPINCGDIVESEFTDNAQRHDYEIVLEGGDSLNVSVIPLGETLETTILLWGSTGQEISRSHVSRVVEPTPSIETPVLSAPDTYQLMIGNSQIESDGDMSGQPWDLGGLGIYTIYIGCTLRDGTVIEPGDSMPPVPSPTTCEGICFPLLFPNGIEIPITLGQPQTTGIANDVMLYTYDASKDTRTTLSLSRVSGDISIGVTVTNQETNELLFVGGMPYSDNLSVDLTFPTNGTYEIALFRLDTANKMGTSGAITIGLE